MRLGGVGRKKMGVLEGEEGKEEGKLGKYALSNVDVHLRHHQSSRIIIEYSCQKVRYRIKCVKD